MNPTTAQPVDATLRDAALRWQVTLWSGEVTADERKAFARWLDERPEHQAAWQQVQQMDHWLRALPGPAAGQALRAPAAGLSRRKALGLLGTLAGAGLVTYAGHDAPVWHRAVADHATGRGERRAITLADGTRVMLNSASALDVQIDAHQRRLVLRAGDIWIDTAADPAGRPFLVDTAQGTVQALGTRFTVRQADDHAQVTLFDGVVALRPVQQPNAGILLNAGQQARLRPDAVTDAAAASPAAEAWVRGLLVAERMRLADVVAELGRHRPGVARCDPAVAALIVSGVYPLDDTDRALAALAQALPVRVQYATRYWVTVSAR